MKPTVALIGATGNVGCTIIKVLNERKLLNQIELRIFCSSLSAGKELSSNDYCYKCENIEHYEFKNCKIALFATDSNISKKYIERALTAGAYVVDSSSLLRLREDIPLIVPPINIDSIILGQKLYATANCLASSIATVLKPLHAYNPIIRVNICSYQSVSGAGKLSMEELYEQTKNIIENKNYELRYFSRPIAFNVIPMIDTILEDEFSYEEFKIIKEVQKIVCKEIKIAATAVRVPVMVGHGISSSIEFKKEISLNIIKEILFNSPGIQLSHAFFDTPLDVEGKDDIFVGRLRKDPTVPSGILLWQVSDNLRRGAALDMVEIIEKILTF